MSALSQARATGQNPHWSLRASWRFFRQRPGQALLTLLGLALGVAIATSVILTTASARTAFKLSTESLYGAATHQLVGGSQGVPAAHYHSLRTELGLEKIAPIIQTQATLLSEVFTLLGTAPLAEAQLRPRQAAEFSGAQSLLTFVSTANTVALDHDTAERLGLQEGDSFEINLDGTNHSVTLGLVFSPRNGSANLMLSYIENTRQWLQRGDNLDRIDLKLDSAELARVQRWLPSNMRLVASASHSGQMQEMTAAFNTNLTAMSLLALLVGAFLIHNTMSFLVVSRRQHYALYRSLGVSRREIVLGVLAEALLLALIGSLLGALVGVLLAQQLIGMVTQTINDLYFVLSVRDLHFSVTQWLMCLILGTLAGVLPAVGAALDAASTPPGQLVKHSALEQQSQTRRPLIARVALLLALLGWGLLALPSQSLLPGFAALFAVVLAYALLVPQLSAWLFNALRQLNQHIGGLRHWRWGHTLSALQRNMSRYGVALAALCVAISATVGVDVMVGSFRGSVDLWLKDTLRADIYISAPSSLSSRADGNMDPALKTWLQNQSAINNITSSRMIKIQSRGGELGLFALDPGDYPLQGFKPMPHPANDAEGLRDARRVQISEPLARKQSLAAGDKITLFTDRAGWRDFDIANVFKDYGSSQGTVVMHRELYNQHWYDSGYSSVGVVLQNPQQSGEQLAIIRHYLKQQGYHYLLRDNQSIREQSLAVFDRTFAITHVLRLLTIGVAFLGLFSALMSVLLEKTREFAVFRALGARQREMTWLIVQQALLIGLVAGLLALPLGLLLAYLLIDIINVRSFGWSIDMQWSLSPLVQAVLLGLVAALLASVWPALRLRKLHISHALRME
ncbi:MAG: ABC transporter permease [Granulosicoccaceae bacterium]